LEDIKEATEEVVEETQKPEQKVKKEPRNKHKEEINKLKAEIAELKNTLLRNRADLENFKKHMKEEAIKDRKYASQNLITEIITPLEYLTRACEFQTDSAELNNFLIGFKMIAGQLTDVLVNDGLKVIDVKIGDEFDPTVHQAVATEKHEEMESNKVLEVVSKGYLYKERIIKPAMVKVSE
jgi:molecular chaperone GrpE